jgi:Arc/MetJ-type ribon-helix-helix transcriptional regulator
MMVRMRIVRFWLDGSSLPCIVSGARWSTLQLPVTLQFRIVKIDPFPHQPQGSLRTQITKQNIPVEINRSLVIGERIRYKVGLSDSVRVARLLDAKSYLRYYYTMSVAKVAVSIDDQLLQRLDSLVAREVFRSRSEAIQKAVAEKLARMDRGRLARECAKLLPAEEQRLAEEGIGKDASEWPEY